VWADAETLKIKAIPTISVISLKRIFPPAPIIEFSQLSERDAVYLIVGGIEFRQLFQNKSSRYQFITGC
ncbi:MAG: hypothetical protein ACREBV_05740, partial [Candidatus Zixiibacteriota bacterium]